MVKQKPKRKKQSAQDTSAGGSLSSLRGGFKSFVGKSTKKEKKANAMWTVLAWTALAFVILFLLLWRMRG